MILYLCARPEAWGLSLQQEQVLPGHTIGQLNGLIAVWPQAISEEAINPVHVQDLFEKLGSASVLVLDRLQGVAGLVAITDHVNRSGRNFLTGRTPFGKRSTFPDMSAVYQPVAGLEGVVVHTVGPDDFPTAGLGSVVISEAAGLVTPVLHYLGLRIQAVGGEGNEGVLSRTKTFLKTISGGSQ